MSAQSLADLGPAFLDQLKATAGATWAKIPDAHKALAERLVVRWLALKVRESLGLDVIMEARAIVAIFDVLEDEVEQLVKSALIEFAEKAGVVLGKVALGVLKGAVPGLGAVLPAGL